MSLDGTLLFEFDFKGNPKNLDFKLYKVSITLNQVGENDLSIDPETIIPGMIHLESGTEYGPDYVASRCVKSFKVRYKIANGTTIN